MVEYPYTNVTGKLKKFLEQISSIRVPSKVDPKYLSSIGFKSSNDPTIITVLKFIGFLDVGGAPTQAYRQFRSKDTAGGVMAESLKAAYKDLFETYSNAYEKDNTTLRNYFSAHTDAGKQVLDKTVGTFKVLCEFADFEAPVEKITVSPKDEAPVSKQVSATTPGGLTVNINIQLQLPATDDASVYDNLFSALRKHLF